MNQISHKQLLEPQIRLKDWTLNLMHVYILNLYLYSNTGSFSAQFPPSCGTGEYFIIITRRQ